MQYRAAGNTGIELSALGFGCMRLPKMPDDRKTIDVEASHRLFARARELGVNYFDTAYVYNGGASERCLGEFVETIDRSAIHISTKNPVGQRWFPIPGDVPTGDLYRRLLEEELERLRTDYLDFYVFHDQSLVTFRIVGKAPGGPLDQARKAKDEGLIRHIGLSSHDTPQNIQQIIEMADGAIELLICQYNLLDRKNEPLIEYAHEKGIGVSVMGPVGGGRLQHPSEIFTKATGAASTAEAAIRFVLANPHVTTAMSG
ncbi:MAG: aldo/keto reductase, partial [Planctomycetota bacterium]